MAGSSLEVSGRFAGLRSCKTSEFDAYFSIMIILFEPMYLIFKNVHKRRKKGFLSMDELNVEYVVIFVHFFVCCDVLCVVICVLMHFVICGFLYIMCLCVCKLFLSLLKVNK